MREILHEKNVLNQMKQILPYGGKLGYT